MSSNEHKEEVIMKQRRIVMAMVLLAAVVTAAGASAAVPQPPYTTIQLLGGALYFDKNLSILRNQSCASCHLPAAGFDDPESTLPVSEGSIAGKFGDRNAPSSAYAAFAPKFAFDDVNSVYFGGQFWDGRVDNLAQQAAGPPTNPVEMAMPTEAAVVARLAENPAYVLAFKKVFSITLRKVMTDAEVLSAYNNMALAIGEFERTRPFNRFNSKFDFYLAGFPVLNEQEKSGLALFNGPKAKCSQCHPSDFTFDGANQQIPPLFTDFTYDNLGIPVNPEIARLMGLPSLDPDLGLGKRKPGEEGKFKVMTLRNIAKTAPYGHNGYFKTLKDIVHFYNTRDVKQCSSVTDPQPGVNCWPAPEVIENLNQAELGNLGLSPAEEADLVAFLMTLTDGIGPSPFGLVAVPPMPW
jgi:cytochrome c peroxidase